MKTYLELEEIGIISTFKDDGNLMVIVKGGDVYFYFSEIGRFGLHYTL